jgi:hypothetical protein
MTFAQAVSLLRHDSRVWWHYADLRKQGKHGQAREKEIGSVRSLIRNLREGHLAGIALNGVWLHGEHSPTESWSVSRMSENMLDVLKLWAPHIPIVDKRTIPEHLLARYVSRCNIYTSKRQPTSEETRWGYVDPGVYCAVWEKLGATVHWGRHKRTDYIGLAVVVHHVNKIQGKG